MPWLVVNGCMKYFRDDDPKYETMKVQQENKPKKRKRTKKSKCECADESCSCC